MTMYIDPPRIYGLTDNDWSRILQAAHNIATTCPFEWDSNALSYLYTKEMYNVSVQQWGHVVSLPFTYARLIKVIYIYVYI